MHKMVERRRCGTTIQRRMSRVRRSDGVAANYIFIFLKSRLGIARTSSMIQDQNQGR